jgi:phosphate:Na+ symporter
LEENAMSLFDVFTLSGGLGLFLYGMDLMGKGLESAAGSKLKHILEKLTTNRLMGVLVGAVVTMIIQSSSATTVMLVGFVNAGLMNLSQAFGVMLGANIGTTITAQIIAFNLSDWAPLLIMLGVAPLLFVKKRKVRSYATIVAGFGILFLGMNMMGDALTPLRDSPWFINAMTKFENPIYGVLMGTVFTAVIQSSSASVGIVQVLALQGLVGLHAGLYLVLGCNIGTCATSLLASIGTNTMAKRTAVMHLNNKIVGVIVFTGIVFAFPVAEIVSAWTPSEPSRQIANFHTLFNILNTILLMPFGTLSVKIATKLVKEDERVLAETSLMYLDEHVVQTPTIALSQIQKEVGRLSDKAIANVELSLQSFFERNEEMAAKVVENEQIINRLSAEILMYLVRVQSVEEIPASDRRRIFELHEIVSNIERISDHAENISEYAYERILNGTPFSLEAIDELSKLANFTVRALVHGTNVFKGMKDEKVETLACNMIEREVNTMAVKMREDHIARLHNGCCDPRAALIYSDMTINLERLSDHACNLAGLDDEMQA